MSTTTITLHVTAAHIAAGRPQSSRCCPVALALQDQGYQEVAVGPLYIRVRHPGDPDRVAWFDDHPEIFAFVQRFDEAYASSYTAAHEQACFAAYRAAMEGRDYVSAPGQVEASATQAARDAVVPGSYSLHPRA